ncbi:uncharacterized protein LOC124291392 [Haliotis rubra]|uniref:uncharacterized protein LOC124291392 n=1 Tax=Haliotis rubra TaxID=36100 RepID=UPI001EE54C6A|nr:uncharacterized protein LOC124291392 [Haliotis rubra]
MQSLVIKMIYERQGSETTEVRRFTVPSDTAQSYTFINEKVMQVFPHLEADTFKLCWTDADGDLVTFSSQEELEDALSSARDSVMKIVVREHDVANIAEGVTSLETNAVRRLAFENEAGFGGRRMMKMEGVQPRHFRRLARWTGKGPRWERIDDVERAPDGDVNAMITLPKEQVRRNCNHTDKSGHDVCRNGRRWNLHASSRANGAEGCTVNGWRHRRHQRRSDPTADEDTASDDVIPRRVCWRRWRRQRELDGLSQRDGNESHGTSPARPCEGRWRRQLMQGECHLQQQNAIGETSPLKSCGQRWRRSMMREDARVQRDETTRKCGGPWRRRMMQEARLHRDANVSKCPKPWRRRAMQGDGTTEEDLSLSPHWRSMQASPASRYAMGTKGITEQYHGCLGTRKSFLAGCEGFQAARYDGASPQRPDRCHRGQREASRKRWCPSNGADFRRWSRRNEITEDERCPNGHFADGSFVSCQRRRDRCMSFPRNMPGCNRTNEERCLKKCVRFCDDETESHDNSSSDPVQRGSKWQRACPRNIRRRFRLQMMMGETSNFKSSEEESCGVVFNRFPRKTLSNYYGHNRRYGKCDQMNQGMPKCNGGYNMQRDRMNMNHRRGPTFQIHRLRTVRRMRRLRYLMGLNRLQKHQRSGKQGQRRRPVLRLHLRGTGSTVGGVCGVRGHRGTYLFGMGTHLADTVPTCPASYSDKFSIGYNSTNSSKHEKKIACPAMGKSWGCHKACYREFGRMMRSNSGKNEGRMTCQKKDVCNDPEDAGTQTPYKLPFHEKRRHFLMKRILQKERRLFRTRKLLASRCGHGRWSNRPVMMMTWRGRPSTCVHGGPRVLSVA